ncbi:phytoene desaturase [Hyphomonas sp.]|uniref:phytoene desaturase n=1 Tax=Hyphomonas sp. TaxID=87 RepID=UPI0025C591B6|nr:phytoene desaturase [Hyphomonas sp.]MBI1400630.1 phytoene desaturase [Hyphomonas sp.]
MDGIIGPRLSLVDAPHAVVIGSGFGGLAAAVRLGAKGYRVTVVEKLHAPGGRAYTWHQDGFTFDAGPTILTAPHLFDELWDLCDRQLSDEISIRSIDPFYRIRFDDGTVFEAHADDNKTRAEIAKFAPEDVAGFDRFQKASRAIFEAAYTKLADEPFHELSTLLKAAPDMLRLGGVRSVYAKVSDYFTNEKLRIAFSFHPLFIGGDPFAATSYYCLISHLERVWGVHYAIGGTGALVRGLADLIESQGNQLRCNTEVDEILTESGRATGVRLKSGEVIACDLVVSNAEIGWTYSQLLRNTKRRVWTDARVARADYSMSLFVWYFGTRRQYLDCYHHTIVLGPRYRGLLKDIFRKKVLAEDFSLYLHRPTANDPSLAPEGCDTFYVLAPVPHLDSGTDWENMAAPFRDRIAQRLEETVLPGLRQEVVSERIMTPLDFQQRLLSTKGAAFGLEPKLLQSAWFRPHNISADVEGLYLVGAGTHPGAGVPSVLSSAKVVDKLIPEAALWSRKASV